MRIAGQIAGVVAIALGTGLLVAGGSVDPVLRAANNGQMVRTLIQDLSR